MYEFLKKLFGTVDGQPEALTYEQLEAKIKGDKNIKLVNLSDGGYVSEDKFKAKETELTGVKQQLTDANTTIQSLKDKGADVDKVTKEWEDKYNKDTQDLKDKLSAQERSHQTDLFLSGYKYTSKAAQAGIKAEFEKKNFQLDNGVFLGASDYMKTLMENEDYKGAFVTEDAGGHGGNGGNGGDGGNGQGAPKPPQFASGTNGGNGGAGNGGAGGQAISFGFTRIREPKTNN
jgi:phage minor structural protein GP20